MDLFILADNGQENTSRNLEFHHQDDDVQLQVKSYRHRSDNEVSKSTGAVNLFTTPVPAHRHLPSVSKRLQFCRKSSWEPVSNKCRGLLHMQGETNR